MVDRPHPRVHRASLARSFDRSLDVRDPAPSYGRAIFDSLEEDAIRSEILSAMASFHVWAVDFVRGRTDRDVFAWPFMETDSDAAGAAADLNGTDQLRTILARHSLGLRGLKVRSRSRLEREFGNSRFYATR
jgi:hypothetical protein